MTIRAFLALSVFSLLAVGCTQTPATHFGEPMTGEGTTFVSIDDLVADPEAYDGKKLHVQGEISSVCKPKGCWLRLAAPSTPEGSVFVKFTCPVEGRLIPLEAVGKEAVVEGTLKYKKIDEGSARHIAEEGGATPEEVAKIVGYQWLVEMQSPAAKIYGLEPVSMEMEDHAHEGHDHDGHDH